MSGSQLLSVGYISLAALVVCTRPLPFLLHIFESVGKLSRTNCLMQTIICTYIFYGYGLGFYRNSVVFLGVVFGIILYSLQCVFSMHYLKNLNVAHSKLHLEWARIGP